MSSETQNKTTPAAQNSEVIIEDYQANQFIFFEGDLDFNFYIIESGQVEIFTQDKIGQRVSLAKLGPGETFGEMAFLDSAPRTASAQALCQTRLFKVSAARFEELLLELPVWAQTMLKTFTTRLRETNSRIKNSSLT